MPQQKQFKVLLIGDSGSDEYVYGICGRLNKAAAIAVTHFGTYVLSEEDVNEIRD